MKAFFLRLMYKLSWFSREAPRLRGKLHPFSNPERIEKDTADSPTGVGKRVIMPDAV